MICVLKDLESISQAAVQMFIERGNQAIDSRGCFSVALSGGKNIRRLCKTLANSSLCKRIRWDAIHVFWSDERCVSESKPCGNVMMAHQALLDFVPILPDHIHPIQGNLSPKEAAANYEIDLRNYFGNHPPVLDLVLLELGDNAHTASLYPHTSALFENERLVMDVFVPGRREYSVTMTPRLINQARTVVFLVSGSNKASAIKYVIEGVNQPNDLPAQLIQPNGAHPIWLVDRLAAEKLTLPIGLAFEQ